VGRLPRPGPGEPPNVEPQPDLLPWIAEPLRGGCDDRRPEFLVVDERVSLVEVRLGG
jgi:hypothetical protein